MDPPAAPVEPLSKALMNGCRTPVSDNHQDKYGVPLLEELGFDTEGLCPVVWPGGETEALTRIDKQFGKDSASALQEMVERPKLNSSLLLASPLGLSPYLRFGCLSCRLFYSRLTQLYNKAKKNANYDKLLWREFFYTAATNNPRFDKMEGNPICIRIPWDKNPEALAKWAEAKTGFPWIDAILTQLRQEGWIHHLARHAVACFLTRGDLWISWEEGMKVFEELLLDADWSMNAGSWMCHSCSSFFQQFFHCYCPVGFGRRIDPNGDFIRRYLPVLRGFPAKYIYDPWNAPEEVQLAARCRVGVDYPKPMVNHAEASRLNIERMRQIYQQLSRYRGLSLLATVPSNHGEDVNVNSLKSHQSSKRRRSNGHGSRREKEREREREQRSGEEHAGPSGVKHRSTGPGDPINCRGAAHTLNGAVGSIQCLGHCSQFAIPQHIGRVGRSSGGGGKRARESEQESGADNRLFASPGINGQWHSKEKNVAQQDERMTMSS
ncbi:cryptochrome circadian regulator 3b isoform X3 [Engraulis encrasicolus]